MSLVVILAPKHLKSLLRSLCSWSSAHHWALG